ncbi:RhoGEF domain-containing protein [Legionella clemsonensis]|uniref:RhoGEF domain protein n=1 Tax=Legionella clemsonensis TaxID=1867846 RepID=A0A222P0H0_9GAMM|nr:RhoGEF domain-containing protein [Legionella clemsonensis]ASQ45285.1 RhoGEF domain protein [Legionella clemsonensis]
MLPVNEIQKMLDENKVIKEILDTESTYNKTLDFLLKLSMPDSELFAQLKIYLSQLKEVSDRLIENVKVTFAEPNISSLNALKIHRIQLIKAFFTLYKDYLGWHEIYLKEVAANPAKFNQLNQYLSTHSPDMADLSFYLIQPVQRGPRYALLAAEIIKCNNRLADGHPAKFSDTTIADLMKVIEVIKERLQEANSSMSQPSSASSTTVKPYQFGDYTRAALAYLGEYMDQSAYKGSNEVSIPSTSAAKRSGYNLSSWCSIWSSHSKPQPAEASSSSAAKPEEDTDLDSEAEEFVLM